LLLSPVLLAVALLIRVDSAGPALFRQWRRGRDGRPFRMLKFRTMIADAERRLGDLEWRNEAAGGVLLKLHDDPRVTRLGQFLRRTSLDELPQLINVLKGEMSLVGPRPLQLRDSERLAAADPWGYARRLLVLPGLTGPWQVEGRSALDYERMVALDCDYVANRSPSQDLAILAKTVLVVLRGRGAFEERKSENAPASGPGSEKGSVRSGSDPCRTFLSSGLTPTPSPPAAPSARADSVRSGNGPDPLRGRDLLRGRPSFRHTRRHWQEPVR
jgi:lipopolysaccharide/colanic/teichoic acid biosynthesis glycosyltransferase